MTEINLTSAAGVRAVMTRFGIANAKKKLGQHFLIDSFVLSKIIAAAEISPGDFVLEIGPGIGGMTQALLNRGARVTAVELDKQLVPVLRELFSCENFNLIHDDILRTDLREIISASEKFFSCENSSNEKIFSCENSSCEKKFSSENVKIVANLPYYITTPVIFFLLESGVKFESITVMIQKEVARRMNASPGTKDYGALSLAVQYYADVELVANVPTNCFMPRPNVDSAVVKLKILPAPRVDAEKNNLFRIIHAAFGKRRKTLLNALDSDEIEKSALAEILQKSGIDPQARGETLDIFQFARLAENLK